VRVPLPAAGVAGVFLLAVPQLLNRFIGDRVYLLRGETQRDKDIAPMDLFTAGARGAPPPPLPCFGPRCASGLPLITPTAMPIAIGPRRKDAND